MQRRRIAFAFVWAFVCAVQSPLQSQEFRVFDRTIQVHGFASQGFVYTNDNNWLTMESSDGSAAFTDFGLNMSTQVTDKLRVGAQGYDRNLGQLGQYHPSLDWAMADYRFKSWFGIRGGKVKTTLGLYNDTQDLDFLHTFALLPQSMYPTDLRDADIAHVGGDVYGTISLRHTLGDISYTAYAGHRSDSLYSGYPFLLKQFGTYLTSLGGLQYGGDLRWNTPLKGLLIGASRLDQDITGTGTAPLLFSPVTVIAPYKQANKSSWTNQYYAQFERGKLRIDSEYRRYLEEEIVYSDESTGTTDVRGWYIAGAYRLTKWFELGSYYSRYDVTATYAGVLSELGVPNQTDTSLPGLHIYDKVVTGRIDLTKLWNVKVEGHFMDGNGGSAIYPNGFYPQVNPNGYQPNTNALVVKTSFHF